MPADDEPIDVIGMACQNCECDWQPWAFQRRGPRAYDVVFDVHYCGVCHSDLHISANHMKGIGVQTTYPFIAGHEIAGVVTKVGSKVTRFKVGDPVGVGCMVDSCGECEQCKAGREHKCKKPASFCAVQSYNDLDRHGRAAVWPEGSRTRGGFSDKYVVHENYGIRVPKDYPLECAGPMMCSGITMYEPLVEYGMAAGSRVAIAGLGGVGGMGIKIAKQMGCKVTAISRGMSKQPLATSLGADSYLDSKDPDAMSSSKGTFDMVLDTIPIHHDLAPYRSLLTDDGKLILIGITPAWLAKSALPCTTPSVKHSLIGGIKRTEDVLELCNAATPKILPLVELRPVQDLNSIFTTLDSGNDTGHRYVLDIKGTMPKSAAAGPFNVKKPTISDQGEDGLTLKLMLTEWWKLWQCCACQKRKREKSV